MLYFVVHSKIKRTYRRSMFLVFYTNNLNTNRFVGICTSCKFKCTAHWVFSTSKINIFYKYDFPLLYFQSHLTTKESNFTNNSNFSSEKCDLLDWFILFLQVRFNCKIGVIFYWLRLTSSLILRFSLLKEDPSTRENIGGLFLKGNLYSSPSEGETFRSNFFKIHSSLLSQKKIAGFAVRLCKLDFLWSIRLLKSWDWIMRSLIDYFLGGRVWRTTISYKFPI